PAACTPTFPEPRAHEPAAGRRAAGAVRDRLVVLAGVAARAGTAAPRRRRHGRLPDAGARGFRRRAPAKRNAARDARVRAGSGDAAAVASDLRHQRSSPYAIIGPRITG